MTLLESTVPKVLCVSISSEMAEVSTEEGKLPSEPSETDPKDGESIKYRKLATHCVSG